MSSRGDELGLWLDGRLVPAADAAVSPLDHGFTVGDGVFETCKVVAGRPFALRRHLARLRRSAKGMAIEVPFDDEELDAACTEAIGASTVDDGLGRLRITVTSGPAPLGSRRDEARPTVVVVAQPMDPWPDAVDVATVPWPLNERAPTAGIKTTSYASNVLAIADARRRGADEAIFANTAGDLCEGAGSNVFVAVDGRLATPPLSSGCLAGVTRDLVIELVDVEVAPLPVSALLDADEAFLTSTTRDVQPIRAVDGIPLPHCPGPLTRAAQHAFTQLQAETFDP